MSFVFTIVLSLNAIIDRSHLLQKKMQLTDLLSQWHSGYTTPLLSPLKQAAIF